MGVGRVFCVALPFLMTVASLIALLVAGLAGVTDKSLSIFTVNTTDLTVSASSLTSLLNHRSLHDIHLLDDRESTDAASAVANAVSSTNITGSDLGLSDLYYISLWGYCQTTNKGDKQCRKPQYNWATNATKAFEHQFETVASSTGENVTLPHSVKDAMSTFSTVMRWTEVVFLIAYIALAASLLLGIFANCSRVFSCCTFIISAFAAVAVCASAALATATSAVIIGVVEGTAKKYDVTGSINTHFLAAVWISAACALASALFWMFTICCCAPDHSRSRGKSSGGFGRKRNVDVEKVPSGAYAPLGDNHNTSYGGSGAYPGNGAYAGHGAYGVNGDYGAPGAHGSSGFSQNPRTGRNADMAYEPYSHRA